MFERRWSYSNPFGLSKWYGHVDYYGQYVIGQWFVLDAETGKPYWSRRFFRPTTICGCVHDVIVASETRSDGPWTAGFGIYGIDARSGSLLWVNHGRGLWGKLLRCLDYVPGFANEFRDVPKCLVDQYVVTTHGRILDVRTGRECPSVEIHERKTGERTGPQHKLYDNKSLDIDGHTIRVEGQRDDFVIRRYERNGNEIWRFAAKDLSLHVDGNYYSYRFHEGRIFIILGDALNYVPINKAKPLIVKSNPANYQLGILDISSGECTILPLANGMRRNKCRIEAIRDSRLLLSCDGMELAEYEITK